MKLLFEIVLYNLFDALLNYRVNLVSSYKAIIDEIKVLKPDYVNPLADYIIKYKFFVCRYKYHQAFQSLQLLRCQQEISGAMFGESEAQH